MHIIEALKAMKKNISQDEHGARGGKLEERLFIAL
jgi:hypothetical protein